MFALTWLLVGLPLLGAAVLLLGGRRTDRWGHWLGVLMSGGSFVVAVLIFFGMLGRSPEDRTITQHLFDWIAVGTFNVPFDLRVDQLSMTFVLLITGVGTLIHIYSVGYMSHDHDRRRFFAYLNLFVASMLLLVLANNYLLLYVGWEGVGLASYLLIGFWFYKDSAAVASKKAFVVNRVGDVGLSLAVMLMFVTFGSVTFDGVLTNAASASESQLTWIGLALLLAACGKSAQFPLQSWLLDAMEGPTPVSALIHAATMVTAGVYLIARSNAIFDAAPTAQTAVVIIGAITLLMGAVIGSAKDDIKKALAGSTMSQIGYMVLAAGLGPVGYVFAIFHLLTHGFFKATMFLGAGSVMHGMNDNVNMRRYGGLRAVMVVTWITFMAGYLAILGIPPFAGFFSKDKIIEAAFSANTLTGLVTLLGAGITAFYMTRLVAMTFFGKARWEDDAHPHESPGIMTGPIAVLAFLSTVGGFLLAFNNTIEHWLEPVLPFEEPVLPVPIAVLTFVTLAVVVVGAVLGWVLYARRSVPVVAPAGNVLTRAARADLYGDAFNEAVFMRPGQYLTRWLVWFDNRVVDGVVNGVAATIGGLSGRSRRLQTGFTRSYALSMLGGAALVVFALVLVRL
ncbi:NADH-quinone oxidoreductase subunit L [Longivirga aurantiaca]|uniref:NADH-quinone oxidoreductase subunit L n=1 Tax=Longivirga aurantiaca TaxID=1837743 RepID=A0ABW1SZ61_9ACTN